MSVAFEDVVAFFETIEPASVARIRSLYTEDAFFKDPFNEVRGAERIERIFAHMFEQVGEPRFIVHERFVKGGGAMLTWDFTFRMAGRADPMLVRGASHLRFADDGRIAFHRDYWDAAEELYAKLPIVGALMRVMRRRLAAG